MKAENADGELHPLSHDQGYALRYIHYGNSCESDLDEVLKIQQDFTKKYVNYIIENDMDKVRVILERHFAPNVITGHTSEDLMFILRPPWIISCLAQKASFVMKFKRVPNDSLKEEPLH